MVAMKGSRGMYTFFIILTGEEFVHFTIQCSRVKDLWGEESAR